jgi:hypothetical protein
VHLDRFDRDEECLRDLLVTHLVGGELCHAPLARGERVSVELFVEAVSNADWSQPEQAKATVVGRMKEYESSDELQFLMELSIEPIAAKSPPSPIPLLALDGES